jgi:uncharacterized damage-inducible protein DinB
MRHVDAFFAELDQEAVCARKMYERLPADKLSWRPHPRSYSLGQLALHVATIPVGLAEYAKEDIRSVPDFKQEEAKSREEVVNAFEDSLAAARAILTALPESAWEKPWTLEAEGTPLWTIPRSGLLRTLLLNHFIHHRGALSVYLRLLEVPVPSIYGPSADEIPDFAAAARG